VISSNQLTRWSWALFEKPPVLQLLKNLPTIYGIRRFITVFTRVSSIQSVPSHSIPLRSILILSSNLRLCIPSGLFPSGFPTKILYALFLLISNIGHLDRDRSTLTIYLSIYLSIYRYCRPWPLFRFLNLYTDGRTPWTEDVPVVRPLSTHRTTQTQNTQTHRHPYFEWYSNPRSQRSSGRRRFMP
jgi:hypothetical protein